MNQQDMKRAVARAALAKVEPYLSREIVIGIGTGSTVNEFIDLLGAQRQHFDAAVSSSEASRARLEALGIRVIDLNAAPAIPVYVDGADEADRHLRLIKGGGGALTREKIIAASAEQFICMVDQSKRVDILGKFPLPVEVIPMARGLVARHLVKMGAFPEWRQGFTTDNGNIILDVHGLDIVDPIGVETQINNITGVVCVGLFAARKADLLLTANSDGSVLEESATAS